VTETDRHYFVMGSGSRSMILEPDARSIYDNLEAFVLELYESHPNMVCYSGMAEGWDEALAKVCMRNKIPYICVIPHPTYGVYYWRDHSVTGRDRHSTYLELLQHASSYVTVANTLYVDGVHANFVRNQWMVDRSQLALVYKATSPGTRDAVARMEQRSPKLPKLVYPFKLQSDPHQESLL